MRQIEYQIMQVIGCVVCVCVLRGNIQLLKYQNYVLRERPDVGPQYKHSNKFSTNTAYVIID